MLSDGEGVSRRAQLINAQCVCLAEARPGDGQVCFVLCGVRSLVSYLNFTLRYV